MGEGLVQHAGEEVEVDVVEVAVVEVEDVMVEDVALVCVVMEDKGY